MRTTSGRGRFPDRDGPRTLTARAFLLRPVLGALVSLVLLASAPGCRREVEVTLLSFNDLHGALVHGGVEPESARPWGGARALAARVMEQRRLYPRRTFLLDAGDTMQGTPESNLVFGRSSIEFTNRLGVDAAALGNHEFDWGIDTLRSRIAEMRYPFLAANVWEKSGARPAWLRPCALLERDGVRLGVIGLVTPETPRVTYPPHVASLRFAPPEQGLQAVVDSLRASGADLIVLLAHLGAVEDSSGEIHGPLADLGRSVHGVDAIVGGHRHALVAGHVAGVPVVVAGSKGRAVGRILLRWDGRRVLGSEASVLGVYADSLLLPPADPIAVLVDSMQELVRPLVERVLARAVAPLDAGALANLVTDAMREAAGADVAVTNAGGIRTEFPAGEITEGDLFELLPFENRLVSARLTGEQLGAFLDSGAREARVSGLSVRLVPRAPRGERVRELLDAEGRPLVPNRSYRVVTLDFIAHGGDGFEGFLAGTDVSWTSRLLRDVVRAWILARRLPDGSIRPDGKARVVADGTGSERRVAAPVPERE